MSDIRHALDWAFSCLSKAQSEARIEAELLLSHLLAKNRAYLFTYPEQQLSKEQMHEYQALVEKRAQGMPIAYITGEREFWSLSLHVNEHTLIPRHATERLVELTLEHLPEDQSLQVLDLGTGSGAIALALAKERPNWKISACDYSKEALAIAKDNAQSNQIHNVHFYHSDWFNSVPQIQYDAVLSNPPYIAPSDPHVTQGDLRFEPLSALVSGQDGLADLQYIITQSYYYLKPKGLLLLEHGYDQKSSIQAILKKLGYSKVQCWKDIEGNDRVSGGWKP